MAITNGTSPTAGNIGISTSPNQAATYNGQNIIIPNEAAGIGDIVFKNGDTIKVMAGTTYDTNLLGGISALNTTTNVYSSGPMSGYTLMGVIYGWEGGCAMICAKDTAGKRWIAHDSTGDDLAYSESLIVGSVNKNVLLPDGYSLTGEAGNSRRRDKQKSVYHLLNMTRCKAWIASNSSSPDATDPIGTGWPGWPKSETFEATAAVKNKYATYERYLSTLRPMGAGDGGVFSRRWHVGKANTMAMGVYSSSNLHNIEVTRNDATISGVWYPAAQYCYNYGSGGGTYWLPDMYEVRLLMADQTVAKVNDALKKCGTQISISSSLWSSVRYSLRNSWHYNSTGFSNYNYLGISMACRPVTLLKI